MQTGLCITRYTQNSPHHSNFIKSSLAFLKIVHYFKNVSPYSCSSVDCVPSSQGAPLGAQARVSLMSQKAQGDLSFQGFPPELTALISLSY